MTKSLNSPIARWNYQWQLFDKNTYYKPNLAVVRQIISLFNQKLEHKKILELGSGSASDCIELAKHQANCFALDFSKDAKKIALKLAKLQKVTIHPVVADCQNIPFPDKTFDLCFSVGLIEHFKNPQSLIREQLRVLKPNGFLLINVPQTFTLYTLVKQTRILLNQNPTGWETQYSANQLYSVVKTFPLKLIRIFGHDSALTTRLPANIQTQFKKLVSFIETTRLSPYLCLNIGAIYQKHD